MPGEFPDLEALQRLDDGAWDQAFPVFWGVATSISCQPHFGLTRDEANDVALQSIERLVHQIHRVKNSDGLKPYLILITCWETKSFLRRKFSRSNDAALTESWEVRQLAGEAEPTAGGRDPSEEAASAELLALIFETLGGLMEEPRGFIESYDLRGETIETISKRSGKTEQNIRSIICRSLARIRACAKKNAKLWEDLKRCLR